MIRNNVCLNAHPEGCGKQVESQIDYVRRKGHVDGPKNALIIGSSTGYGLASRITAAFASGASTIGIYYERPGNQKRSGTAGWYNNLAFDQAAADAGIPAVSINGDAFSHEVKQQAVDAIRRQGGSVDLVIYSLASGVRTDPETGETYRSVIKPVETGFSTKAVDPATREVFDYHAEPASEEEIAATVKVMGGEDWQEWIRVLLASNVLSAGAVTVAYSYVGPSVTNPIYREGTIGKAKEHLEATASELRTMLAPAGGNAYVSVNKAMVTRASAVIPMVPLYISILFKVMKEKGIHENCIHQTYRLFSERLYSSGEVPVDDEGRIRLDDLEMRADVQSEVASVWKRIASDNSGSLADFDEYWKMFLQFHGFGVGGVDYDRDVEV